MNALEILAAANARPMYHPLGKHHDEYGTIIAFGSTDVVPIVGKEEYPRLLILTLLDPAKRIRNDRNYAVFAEYPDERPPDTPRIEFVEYFANIVPAVECYTENGMDY